MGGWDVIWRTQSCSLFSKETRSKRRPNVDENENGPKGVKGERYCGARTTAVAVGVARQSSTTTTTTSQRRRRKHPVTFGRRWLCGCVAKKPIVLATFLLNGTKRKYENSLCKIEMTTTTTTTTTTTSDGSSRL